jgi:ABC-type amino acid transport substrate-binding protein
MAREYRRTEKALRATFWCDIAPGIPRGDKPALREAFNNWLDSLHRDGGVTDYQAHNITLGRH